MPIHPTAIVDPAAELADDIDVGAYSVIGANVVIGEGCRIGPHVVVNGPVQLGRNNTVYQFASIGEACQDKKYQGEPTKLVVGDNNVIREFVTLHRGTIQDRSETTIGNNNWLMAYVHIAHDCVVGDDTVFANNATLAGHVKVGNGAILGGFTGVHQHCTIGAYSMAGMFSVVNKDVPAYVMVQGNTAAPFGLNVEGMRRRQINKTVIQTLKNAYRYVYRQGLTLQQALEAIALMDGQCPELSIFIESLTQSKRGIVR